MKRALAFDLGASSGRAILGTLGDGKIGMEEVHRFSNDPVIVNGTMYWDTLRQFYEIKQGISRAKGYGGFESIGIDTWGVDFGLLDAHGDLLESGVHLHFHSVLTGCRQEGGRLTHVILDTKSGPQALAARYVIDSTGDGDLCAMMGVPMQENVLPLQPASLCFCLGGVDTDRLERTHHEIQGLNYHNERIQSFLRELSRTREVPTFGGPWFCHLLRPGSVMVNMTRTEADMTDPAQATEAECRLREDAHALTALLREHFPEFRNARILYTAQQAGVRETRHVKGVHVLTGEEYLQAVPFPDAVARSAHPIDIHSGGDSHQRCTFLEKAAYIPYRSLIVPGFDNLLVASRCFSGDQIASASVRVQAPVMCLGQAAGAAAAQCARTGASVHDADIPALQALLREWGAAV